VQTRRQFCSQYRSNLLNVNQWAYFDRLGREVLSISRVYQQSTLRWSATRTRYDLLGRGKEQSVP
jgi:hypothetical protein